MKRHLLLIFLTGFSLNCAVFGSNDESAFELKDGNWLFHDLSLSSNTCGNTFIDTSNLQHLSDSLLPLEVVSSGGAISIRIPDDSELDVIQCPRTGNDFECPINYQPGMSSPPDPVLSGFRFSGTITSETTIALTFDLILKCEEGQDARCQELVATEEVITAIPCETELDGTAIFCGPFLGEPSAECNELVDASGDGDWTDEEYQGYDCGLVWPEDPFHAAIYSFIAEYALYLGPATVCLLDQHPDHPYGWVAVELAEGWSTEYGNYNNAVEYAQAWIDAHAAENGQDVFDAAETFQLVVEGDMAYGGLGFEEGGSTNRTPTCSADCGGALAGNPDFRCDLYNSRLYQSGIVSCDYDATTNSCMVDVSQCLNLPPATIFQECEGYDQGNCETGLECAMLSYTRSVCLIPCQNDSTCADVGGVPGACVETSATGGHCFKKTAQLNEPCGVETDSVCADGQGSCTASKMNEIRDPSGSGFVDVELVDYLCKPVCDPTGADAQATTCGGNLACLWAPTANILGVESKTNIGSQAEDYNQDDFRTCERGSTNTEQCSAGYECTELLLSGDSGTGQFCTLFEHWCGESAGFCGALDEASMTTCAQQNPCNRAPDYKMCAVTGATGTPAMTACWGSLQVNGVDRDPVCITSCEDSELKNEAGDDLKLLDCGTGYECKEPTAGEELWHIHQSAIDEGYAEDASCTDDIECNTEKGFTCISAGEGQPKSCNRPMKTCMALAE